MPMQQPQRVQEQHRMQGPMHFPHSNLQQEPVPNGVLLAGIDNVNHVIGEHM